MGRTTPSVGEVATCRGIVTGDDIRGIGIEYMPAPPNGEPELKPLNASTASSSFDDFFALAM